MGKVMFSEIITQAELSDVLTLEEAKTQCRVTHTMEDEYISALIPVAVEMAQSYCGRMLTAGSAISVIENCSREVMLPFGKVTEVTELLLDDAVSTDFTFEPVTQKLKISSTLSYSKITATYNCGYVTAPTQVKQAILMMISTLYNNRQDSVTGMTVAEMPLTSRMLLDTVKIYGI